MHDELQELADRLRRRREEMEKSIAEHVVTGTDEIVRKLAELRERIELKLGRSPDENDERSE